MIETWKILHGAENVDKRTWFTMVTDVAPRATRVTDRPLNIVKPRWNYEPRSKFYSIRVVEQWNSLPNSVREAKTFNSFKNLYDEWVAENRN